MSPDLQDGRGVAGAPAGSSLAPLYAAGFVTAFGAHAVAANLAGYGANRHVSLIELGALLAVYDGAEVILKPVFGALADRVGAKKVLLGGLLGFAAASAMFVAAGDPGLLGVARFAQGASAAAFSPAAGALVAASGAKKGRGRAFGGYGGAKGLGYLAGPIGGGLLVAAGGYSLLFSVLAVTAVAVAGWSAVAVAQPPAARRARETAAGLVRRLSQPAFLQPVIVLGATTAAFSAGVGFLPVVGRQAGLGPIATGAAVSVLAATSTLIQPRVGSLLDAGQLDRRVAAAGLAMAAIGLVTAAALRGPLPLVAAAALIGGGIGMGTPLGFAALADAAPAGRLGQTMGAGEVGRELGDAGGPLVVGALSVISLAAGLSGLAAIIGIAAVIALPLNHVDRTEHVGDGMGESS
jgi:DHA1 family tetracycline resistance protein-like MFS transporter